MFGRSALSAGEGLGDAVSEVRVHPASLQDSPMGCDAAPRFRKLPRRTLGSGAELAGRVAARLEVAMKPDTGREVGAARSIIKSSDGCAIAYVAYPAHSVHPAQPVHEAIATEAVAEGSSVERSGTRWLLLSSSLGTNAQMWEPQVEAFRRHFNVLCYDSRGHGASGAPPGEYSIERLGLDALSLLDALGIERAHFCGLSKGGMVGQWLGANASERIDRLVLANTAAYLGPASAWQERIELVLARGMGSVVEVVLARWFTPAFRERSPEQVAAVRAMLLATPPAGYASCCAALRELESASLVAPHRRPHAARRGRV